MKPRRCGLIVPTKSWYTLFPSCARLLPLRVAATASWAPVECSRYQGAYSGVPAILSIPIPNCAPWAELHIAELVLRVSPRMLYEATLENNLSVAVAQQ